MDVLLIKFSTIIDQRKTPIASNAVTGPEFFTNINPFGQSVSLQVIDKTRSGFLLFPVVAFHRAVKSLRRHYGIDFFDPVLVSILS